MSALKIVHGQFDYQGWMRCRCGNPVHVREELVYLCGWLFIGQAIHFLCDNCGRLIESTYYKESEQ